MLEALPTPRTMAKRRLDLLLVERGLVESREKARARIMAGEVLVEDRPIDKPGTLVDDRAQVRLLATPRYVSRGGDKLEHALRAFRVDVQGLVCADVGAGTGGFTDCLLQHGARRVYAIDVGYGQLHPRLRQDPRVVVMERTNARYLGRLPEPLDLATVDVSFISLTKVLPPLLPNLRPGGAIVALFKPQFEARRGEVPRRGVIRDPLLHATLIGRFVAWAVGQGLRVLGPVRSPVPGAEGNLEFFFLLRPHA
ncbi:MAG TPA: TlyA family RNA methyltransferase [Dehalococcoidia bacterium]|nr:TlyA family RNA methyltransferase [Dehalococcoidia bacterium]